MQTTRQKSTSATPVPPAQPSHDDYRPLIEAVKGRVAGMVLPAAPLLVTDIDGRDLWNAWLAALPAGERASHDCHACRRFVESFGGLVVVDVEGRATSVVFGDEPGIYAASGALCSAMVEDARVSGVFVSSAPILGTPSTRDGKRPGHTWHHMHADNPRVWKDRIKTDSQRAAELLEDYGTLNRALIEFSDYHVKQALAIAQGDALYRSEKIEGRLKWLSSLYDARARLDRSEWQAYAWRAVAAAPAGFCHVRSSVVGSLLEDLAAGHDFALTKRRFDAKMAPTVYQRPTAAPSVGDVKEAEAIVEKLGLAPALRRRYARLEEIQTVWTPAPPMAKQLETLGVFGHLLERPGPSPMQVAGGVITWDKFSRTVLPDAKSIEINVPLQGHFYAFVTASVADAPPILQWDRDDDARNPVSWYIHTGGSRSSSWGLTPGWRAINAVSLFPNMWRPGFEHHGKGALFVIDGCRDRDGAGLCLFPELLKSDLHAVRATIEAHSEKGKLEGREEASACGLALRGNNSPTVEVRVLANGISTTYKIDRWD